MHSTRSLALMLVVGSLLGGVGSQLLVSAVHAQGAPTARQRWEYFCQSTGDFTSMKAAGERSWELVTTTTTLERGTTTGLTFCYKRPLP